MLFYFLFLTPTLYIFLPDTVYPSNTDIPQPENNAFTLAKGLYNDGLFDLSARQFNLFIKYYPESRLISDAYFYLAEGLYKAEKYNEAVLQYGKILEMYPDFEKTDDIIKRIAECSKNIGESETLLKIFENIFERYSEKGYSSGTAYYYANLLYKKKRYNESLWIFERLAEKIPQGVPEDELFYKLGECLYRAGDFRLASEKWFHVVKKYPKSDFAERALYNLGVLYFVKGDYKESRIRFEKLVNGYPEGSLFAKAVYGAVWSLWKEGLYENGGQYLIAHEERKVGVEKNIVFAIESFYKKEFADVNDKLKKVLEEKPDIDFREDILWLMGRSAEETGDLKGALEIYLKIIKEFEMSRHIGEAYLNAGKIYLSLRDLESTANILKLYTDKYPSSQSLQKNSGQDTFGGAKIFEAIKTGEDYMETDETDKAIELYRGLLDDTAEPLLKLLIRSKLREVYLEKDMYKEFIEASFHFMEYEPAILEERGEDLKPAKNVDTKQPIDKAEIINKTESSVISLYMTADMLAKSGRTDNASELFKRIINDYPDEKGFDTERLNIGLFFLKEKEYDLSIKSFMQVINNAEDNKLKAEVHFWLGETFQGSGRLEDAVIEYLKISYLYPDNDMWAGTARFRAGEIFEMQGRVDEAIMIYQKLSSKYKGDERGKFAAKRLEKIRKAVGSKK
ncbi:MAG: tetratricopeptide repeat protein [Nitrospinae bacterium]|nr:tetratricopeptide repeat protein [Nitrospinota bacterium]